MNELALFAGAGGGILGGRLLGWRTICAVEIDDYARRVLLAPQDDGCLKPFPVWDDITTFDGKPWAGLVDVVSGGFPCQDISAAGKGAGITGERSGLWSEMARVIREVGPRFVLVENSPMLTSRGLGTVLGDLAEMGFDAVWGVLGAHHAGAPHKRDRIWILAYADSIRGTPRSANSQGREEGESAEFVHSREELADSNGPRQLQQEGGNSQQRRRFSDSREEVADADSERWNRRARQERQADRRRQFADSSWWLTEPDVGRVAHGVAARVDRLRCLGNGQVPAVVRLAWDTLASIIEEASD